MEPSLSSQPEWDDEDDDDAVDSLLLGGNVENETLDKEVRFFTSSILYLFPSVSFATEVVIHPRHTPALCWGTQGVGGRGGAGRGRYRDVPSAC